ncbi:unnamed protein product [Caenorhabditis brenneri]
MSDTSTEDPGKPMEQPKNDVAENSGRTSPSLSDMPIDVVGLIIDRSEYKQQLVLRKVSKSLRRLVDNRKPACKSIEIICYLQGVHIIYNRHYNVYPTGLKNVAFDDLASTLKNPRLQLEEFIVHFSHYEQKDYINIMEKCLTGMDQVALLKQWKQAEKFDAWNAFERFPMEHATHFKRFKFNEEDMNDDKFIRIRDFLSKLDNFEQCTLSSWKFPLASVNRFLRELVTINTTEEVFHYRIPDSDYYFEIKNPARSIHMSIEKKKRESH